jgi:phytoene dehydrogenase-like protein
MIWIFVAFVPWIVYWGFSGLGLWPVAVITGLVTALALNAYRLSRRQVKAMELVTLVFFAVHFLVTFVLGSPLFLTYDAVLVSGTLAAMAWGTLLAGPPFTYQYAREDWPRTYWGNPLFRRTNQIITAAWGLVFLLNTALGGLSLASAGARLWLAAILPNLGIGLGVAFSIVFPTWYPRRVLARQIAAREPYRWPAPSFSPSRPVGGTEHDVIVVGAGIGGLTAAALLAHRGLKVLVVEQHYLPGGYCTSWERGVRRGNQRLRYVFDAGVHDISGLGPRGPVRNLIRQLGIEAQLDWRRMRHEYILPNLRLKIPHRLEDFVTLLGAHFPSERQSLVAFFAEMEAVYHELYADVERTGGVPCPPRTVEEMLVYPRRHPHAFHWMEIPFEVMLDTYFHDTHLKQLLSVLTGYLSDDPGALTVAAMAPIFGYYIDGGYYPAGGSQAFADALVGAIRRSGSHVRLRTPVRHIRIERGRALGIETANGEVHRAEAVISNADVRRTFLELVGCEHLPTDFSRQISALQPSTSAFTVFLGVDFVPDVEPITMVVTEKGEKMGLSIPSKVDPGLAPPGHASLVLITLIPQVEATSWDRQVSGYGQRKRRFGDTLIALAESILPGLRKHVVYRQDGSPATFARYAWTTGGAIYGPAAGQWQLARKTPIERLYLAGAGVFPGAGVEAVVISGTLAADAVCGR